MKKIRYIFLFFFIVATLSFIQVLKIDATPYDISPWVMNKRISKGVNFKSHIAINDPNCLVLWESKFPKIIKDTGFNSVRLWMYPMRNAQGVILESIFFVSFDQAIKDCLAQGLIVIITMKDHKEFTDQPALYKDYFISFWEQIATRYKNYPPKLIFDLLNEPHGKLNSSTWNQWVADVIPIIRKTNPNRNLIVGASVFSSWNNLFNRLKLPPLDRHIIAQFHFY